LNSFIPNRSRIEFALEHNTGTAFFGNDVNTLVTTLHGHTSIPSGAAQLFRTKAFRIRSGSYHLKTLRMRDSSPSLSQQVQK